jgi:hypothetical protein
MIDCPNAEMRDRLPDLLHERLDASTRAAVMAHVESCAACRAELSLLREAGVALSSGVRLVDAAAIARVVVARVPTPALFAIRTVRQPNVVPPVTETAVAVAPVTPGGPVAGATTIGKHRPAAHARQEIAVAASSAELSAAGGMSDLSDSDLKALLNDLEKMDAEPVIEPEPVNVRVSPGRGSSE